MRASNVRADSGQRSRSAVKDGKQGGRTRAGHRTETEPVMDLVQRMGREWTGVSIEGVAGGLVHLGLNKSIVML